MLNPKIIIQSLILIFFTNACQKNENQNSNLGENPSFDLPTRSKTKEEFKKSRYFDEDRIKNDKYDVIQNGSEDAYNELCLYYGYNLSKKHELLPYTLIMVEKYKHYNYCTNAFENLYEFYTEKDINRIYNGTDLSYVSYFKTIQELEPRVRNYCLSYIEFGSKKEDALSVKYLEILYRYGLGFNTNIKKADSLKLEFQRLSKIDFNKYTKK